MRTSLLPILTLVSVQMLAQDSQIFTRTKEFYISGNTQVIGNNILSKHASKPFNEPTGVNDEYKMTYVDIDNDNSTFSSSSAFLEVPETSQIVYAGLYWTATYPGERGGKRMRDGREVYRTLEGRSHPIETIKFKMPQGSYTSITGEIIYDGSKAKHKSLRGRAPYVCFKDVTQLLLEQKIINGSYTVANVAALQGKMSGGSSAGWLLYVVYENKEDPLQYITTYHGFEFVNKDPVEIEFGNFQSPEKGEVQTAITIGALEGDNALKRDQVSIYNPEDTTFVKMDNSVRASDNFFNSTITLDDVIYKKRTPASENTLGFDIAKFPIPNSQNAIIANNASGVKLQYKTRADRFFLFFTAFQTTISPRFYKEVTAPKKQEAAPSESVITGTIVEPDSILQSVKTATAPPPVVTKIEPQKNRTSQTEIPEDSKKDLNSELTTTIEKPSIKIPDLSPGYYIVTNVFSNSENAARWSNTLLQKGLEPNTFRRPSNNFYYVFVARSTQPEALYDKLTALRKDEDLVKSWMLKINL